MYAHRSLDCKIVYYMEHLKQKLIHAYTTNAIALAARASSSIQVDRRLQPLLSSINALAQVPFRYQNPDALDAALDAIDLAKIYSRVDLRSEVIVGYEDLVVQELLRYFKEDFFTWVNSPSCSCGATDPTPTGTRGPPTPNPDQISRVELYRCKACQRDVEFARYESPTKLLQTRQGRCGEWVNCFMLICTAVLGPGARLRYVWNYEDHVWCEYYSTQLQRWVHLDPCENAWDQPLLYCENWGKKMSWVVGFGMDYVIDLLEKYVLKNGLPREGKSAVRQLIKTINQRRLLVPRPPEDVYKVLVMFNREVKSLGREEELGTTSTKGRQTGAGQWTESRGEAGANPEEPGISE